MTSQHRSSSNHHSLQDCPYKQHDLNNVVYSTKQPDRMAPSVHDVRHSFSSASVNEETKKSFVIIKRIGSGKISYTRVREEEATEVPVLTHGINSAKTSYTSVSEEEDKKLFIFNQRNDKIPCVSAREKARKAPVLIPRITSGKISFTNVREAAKKSSLFTQEHSYDKIVPTWGDRAKGLEKEILIKAVDEGRWIKHYSSHHLILLVGEGDFSFSVCLAETFGCASKMIATSLDSEEFLMKNYKYAAANLKKLRDRNCMVLHGIDATEMAQHNLLGHLTFDRIVYNFPFAGFFKELPRNIQIQRHQALVTKFLKNAKEMVTENGEIHISHKTNGFLAEWNLESLAYEHGLRLIEAINFSRSDYPGYHTKYGFGGDNDFNCDPSKTYKFAQKHSSMFWL